MTSKLMPFLPFTVNNTITNGYAKQYDHVTRANNHTRYHLRQKKNRLIEEKKCFTEIHWYGMKTYRGSWLGVQLGRGPMTTPSHGTSDDDVKQQYLPQPLFALFTCVLLLLPLSLSRFNHCALKPSSQCFLIMTFTTQEISCLIILCIYFDTLNI